MVAHGLITGMLFFIAGSIQERYGTGLNHFLMTAFYVSIVPPYLPYPLALVIISGLAEIGLGALLLFRRWAPLAAWD